MKSLFSKVKSLLHSLANLLNISMENANTDAEKKKVVRNYLIYVVSLFLIGSFLEIVWVSHLSIALMFIMVGTSTAFSYARNNCQESEGKFLRASEIMLFAIYIITMISAGVITLKILLSGLFSFSFWSFYVMVLPAYVCFIYNYILPFLVKSKTETEKKEEPSA